MQATETKNRTLSPHVGGSTLVRENALRISARNERSGRKGFASGCGLGSGILNKRHYAKKGGSIGCFDGNEVDIELSVDFLYKSALNYCKLLGKELKFKPNGKPFEDIHDIIIAFNKVLPDNQTAIVDYNNHNCLLFRVFTSDDFPDVFVFLPVCNILKMSEPMQEIFRHFIRHYCTSQVIPIGDNHMEYDWVVNEHLEEQLCDPEFFGTEVEDIEFIKSYKEGIVFKTMKEISETKTTPKVVEEKLKTRSRKLSKKDRNLLKVMREGMPLLESGTIGSYGFTPYFDEINNSVMDSSAVDFEQTLGVFWSTDDPVAAIIEEGINVNINEYGCEKPGENMILSPITKEPLVSSNYPMKFYKWYCKLFEAVTDYE